MLPMYVHLPNKAFDIPVTNILGKFDGDQSDKWCEYDITHTHNTLLY